MIIAGLPPTSKCSTLSWLRWHSPPTYRNVGIYVSDFRAAVPAWIWDNESFGGQDPQPHFYSRVVVSKVLVLLLPALAVFHETSNTMYMRFPFLRDILGGQEVPWVRFVRISQAAVL